MKRRLAATALLLSATAFIAFAGLTAPHANSQNNTPSVWIDPTGQQVDYEDERTFTVDVLLSNFEHHGVVGYDINGDGEPDREESSTGLGAYEIELQFNPAVVRVAGMEAGAFLRNSGRSTTCLERNQLPGEYAIGCVSLGAGAGPQGDGLLAVLTLEAVANGTSYLALDAGLAGPLGDTVQVTSDSGIVEVVNGPTSPRPTSKGSNVPVPTVDPGPDGVLGTDDDPDPLIFATLGPEIDTNNDGTPDAIETEMVRRQQTAVPNGNNADGAGDDDGDGGGSATMWIIIAAVGVVAIGVLGGAARLLVRGRAG